jgi:altronate dehydratase small subunit
MSVAANSQEPPQPRCFQVNADDNVATALDDLGPGPVRILGMGNDRSVTCLERVALGHKLALQVIPAGEPIKKYGVPIGIATVRVEPGAWVHLHNCRSRVDERSSHLDVQTGAAKDTVYA